MRDSEERERVGKSKWKGERVGEMEREEVTIAQSVCVGLRSRTVGSTVPRNSTLKSSFLFTFLLHLRRTTSNKEQSAIKTKCLLT